MELIVATKNAGKVKEMKVLFADKGIKVKSLLDLNDVMDIEETGTTFAENAILKAETIATKFQTAVLADDSGLIVDALDGRPGVYSARYAGENASDQENINKLLSELDGIPDEKRSARFHCAIAVSIPGRETIVFHGECEGEITHSEQGSGGFGYDPVFFVPIFNKTMAELTMAEKNKISHRGKALEQLNDNWNSIPFGDDNENISGK